MVAILGPFIPSRHSSFPNNWDEYGIKLIYSAIIALMLAVWLLHEYLVKPARNRRLGYRLAGRFVVLGKQKLLGKAWLELEPDDTHRVGVATELFYKFQKGDIVEVVYSATEDFISLRNVNPHISKL